MTWEELKEEAKELGYIVSNDGYTIMSNNPDEYNQTTFYMKDGVINVEHYYKICFLADNRTPDQMLAIMKALKIKEEVQMKQITIYDLLPLLKPGYMAMDNDGTWCWYKSKPKRGICRWCPSGDYEYDIIEPGYGFKELAPFDGDWKDSLIKVEHKEEE